MVPAVTAACGGVVGAAELLGALEEERSALVLCGGGSCGTAMRSG